MDKNLIIKKKINELKTINANAHSKTIELWEKYLEEKSYNLRGKLNQEITGNNTTWSHKRGYLLVILDCYDMLLENENDKTAKKIFDKYRDLMINFHCNEAIDNQKKQEYEKLFNEILDIKKNIFNLKKELERIIELETAFQAYEEEKERERESFELALSNAEEWHQRDLAAKVEQRLKEKEQLTQVEVPSK